ncbi:MAG TPA: hypothetical protein VFV72_04015 [Candidatus Limnocylindrales bacterium]|nr:hypothetical protein [Candidatus Limnocylindrales bacterium]
MGFLRKILGRGGGEDESDPTPDDRDVAGSVDPDAEERQHELDVLRSEAERMDELTRRQLRYADYAWQPPPQGGERRADDGESSPQG